MKPLLSVDDAQARLMAGIVPLDAETVPLARAHGRRLATDIVATRTQPPFAGSAMDGYAIRWADRAGPWRVIGESAAGKRFDGTAGVAEAVRIFTGAPMPEGADTVIVQEDVARDGETLRLTGDGPPREGAHIRPAGQDFEAGAVVARAGTLLTPARIGLVASAGHGTVPVIRRPRVVILATGDELVPPGTPPGPDQIVSSNGVMLAALLGDAAEVIDGGIVPDRRDALEAAIAAAAGADLLVTIGGASVGDHDLVIPVLTAIGANIDFWKIALRPGKPMLSGRLGDLRIIGLPGNPVSAFVCAMLFVQPLLKAMGGDPAPFPTVVQARLGAALKANDQRQDYLRATAVASPDGLVVTPAARQDSGMLRTVADAAVLIVRVPHAPPLDAGEIVDCHLLDFVPPVA